MVKYFTVERTTEFLLHLEEEGIDTFQSSWAPTVRDALRAARELSESKMAAVTGGLRLPGM